MTAQETFISVLRALPKHEFAEGEEHHILQTESDYLNVPPCLRHIAEAVFGGAPCRSTGILAT